MLLASRMQSRGASQGFSVHPDTFLGRAAWPMEGAEMIHASSELLVVLLSAVCNYSEGSS